RGPEHDPVRRDRDRRGRARRCLGRVRFRRGRGRRQLHHARQLRRRRRSAQRPERSLREQEGRGRRGHNFEKLNIMVGFSFEDQGSMMRNERPYLKQDLRPYGGNDNRIGTNPTPGRLPVIIASGRYYTVPENWVGVTDPETGLKRPTLEE